MDLSAVTGGQAAVLQAKRQSLMDLAKLFGWIVERHDDASRLEERLATMSPEQRMKLARDMAVRLREQVARYREIEAKEVGAESRDRTGRFRE
jgi:hypothetical protein